MTEIKDSGIIDIKKLVKDKQAKQKEQEIKEAGQIDKEDFYSELRKFQQIDHLSGGWENLKMKGRNYHVVMFRYLPKVLRNSSLILEGDMMNSFLDNPKDYDNYINTHIFKVVKVADGFVDSDYKEGDLIMMSHALCAGKVESPEYIMVRNNDNGFNKNPILQGPKYIPLAIKNLNRVMLALPHEAEKDYYDIFRFRITENDIIGAYEL